MRGGGLGRHLPLFASRRRTSPERAPAGALVATMFHDLNVPWTEATRELQRTVAFLDECERPCALAWAVADALQWDTMWLPSRTHMPGSYPPTWYVWRSCGSLRIVLCSLSMGEDVRPRAPSPCAFLRPMAVANHSSARPRQCHARCPSPHPPACASCDDVTSS